VILTSRRSENGFPGAVESLTTVLSTLNTPSMSPVFVIVTLPADGRRGG
jgi:hypothetical protein